MPTSLGDAREVGRLPGRDPACPHGSEACIASPARQAQHERLAFCNRCKRQRPLRGCLALAGEAMQPVLPDDLAGSPSRRPGHFSCFAKRSNQEKATPMMAVRASHGLHTSPAPKSGSVRNSLRSDSGRFFIRFRHQRRGAINGDPHCNGNRNRNRNSRCAEPQATATVAARSQKQPQPSLRGAYSTSRSGQIRSSGTQTASS